MWSTLAALLLYALKAVPPLAKAFAELQAREREAAAEQRRREKDARVDEALAKASERGAPFDESLTAAREIPNGQNPTEPSRATSANPKKVITEEIT